MARLFALVFGLAIAATALYLIVSDANPPPVASKPPSAEIDSSSRAKLERVIEAAESQGSD